MDPLRSVTALLNIRYRHGSQRLPSSALFIHVWLSNETPLGWGSRRFVDRTDVVFDEGIDVALCLKGNTNITRDEYAAPELRLCDSVPFRYYATFEVYTQLSVCLVSYSLIANEEYILAMR
nr:uncharacterized protein CTRU02_07276 [Colletotrichum truncatum]KAF6791514.1 hypothetical protein CTRU02_07276 [Colletotrichum truncatum]